MEIMVREEGTTGLLEELGLPGEHAGAALDLLGGTESRYVRDLKMNLKAVLKSAHIDPKGTALLGLCIAANQRNETLMAYFKELGQVSGAKAEELAECVACASLLACNNVTYRFRHMVGKPKYDELRMGLRMNIMMAPVTGKEFFELMSLAVSSVNGCELCVRSHEASLIELGTSEERIWDAVRLAGVVVSMDRVVH